MDNKQRYQENQDNFFTAVALKEPKWVPIGLDTNTWILAYAGVKTYDIQGGDGETYANAKMKIIRDLKPDYVTDHHCNIQNIRIIESLGGKGFVMHKDGLTIEHTMQGEIMHEDEYEEFIKGPRDFILNKLAERKYSCVTGSKQEFFDAVKKAAPFIIENGKAFQMVIDMCAKEGTIIAWNA